MLHPFHSYASPARNVHHLTHQRSKLFRSSPLFLLFFSPLFLLFAPPSLPLLLPSVVCQQHHPSSQQLHSPPPSYSRPPASLFPATTSLETLNASSRLPRPIGRAIYAPPPPLTSDPPSLPSSVHSSPPRPQPQETQTSPPTVTSDSLEMDDRVVTPRRWYPKAQEATNYLQGMAAPEVAEIIKLTRTGNPVYDGITSVMTVADFGLRQRQGKLHVEAEEKEGGGGMLVVEGRAGGETGLRGKPAVGRVGVERGVKLKGLKDREREVSLVGKKAGGRKAHGVKRDHQGGEHGGIDWPAFRKIVVDEAMDQYFADRQWFMQEILAPVFAEDINAAVERVTQAS
eukprot:GHVS01095801.1.p1 GENE.GHVS01095801.1~~GHVS01095801.1.p1  ORF type:complete len:342 (-),score=78.19 GHVS01095801.1:668-1693(-)